MPTLPLFNSSIKDPDGWHEVASPGGYEWWYFDAEDLSQDIHVVAILLDGFIFHPRYLREHKQFLAYPTGRTPPLPREYRCAYLCVYEKGKIAQQFMMQYPAGDFAASTTSLDVQLGPNRIQQESDGAIELNMSGVPWDLTWQGPRFRAEESLSASLRFTPRWRHRPMERAFISPQLSGAEHRWVLVNPMCDVSGTVRWKDRELKLNARGYHDHNYGSSTIGPGLKRWIWGRVLLDNSVATFHLAMPRQSTRPNEVHLIFADDKEMSEHRITRTSYAWDCRTGWGLKYPSRLSIGKELVLTNPCVIDSTPFYLRLTFAAEVRGQRGTALCEIAYPHRLRYPILGRMIEMSIYKDLFHAGA